MLFARSIASLASEGEGKRWRKGEATHIFCRLFSPWKACKSTREMTFSRKYLPREEGRRRERKNQLMAEGGEQLCLSFSISLTGASASTAARTDEGART